jgi:metal-dependent amidase/aminoacylase/carboxypeptidase family protein
MMAHAWTADIAGELLVDAIVQFFRMWDAIAGVHLGGDSDVFKWKWTMDGTFSSKTDYRAPFQGSTAMAGAAHI